jgi:hypothetical protein
VGEPISHADGERPDEWSGGYEIIRLDKGRAEPLYAIRNPDEASDRIVPEHELRADLGARTRG